MRSADDRARAPRGFYLAHGLLTGMLVLGIGLRPEGFVLVGLAAAGLGLLIQWYRRTTGVWATAFSTTPAARAIWGVYAAVLISVVWAALLTEKMSNIYILAALAVVASPLVGRFLEPAMRHHPSASGSATAPGAQS